MGASDLVVRALRAAGTGDRRHTPAAAFDRLLDLGPTLEPATYETLIARS